jgi:hypothetical protein
MTQSMRRRLRPWERQPMVSPVRCLHCRTIYDMGAVQTTGHYADCSTWRCPGCRLLVDDRCLGGWGGRRDIERVEQPADYELHWLDIWGYHRVDRVIYPSHNGYYPL